MSSRGQIVIPANIRRKHKISKSVLIKEEKGRFILVPARSFEESFGDAGEIAGQAAIEISIDRRKEATCLTLEYFSFITPETRK